MTSAKSKGFLEDRNLVLPSGGIHGLCTSDIASYLDGIGKTL